MAFVFEDVQPQATSPQFVFDDAAPDPATPPAKPKGILESAIDTFAGAGARVAQGVNQSLGAIDAAFGLDQGAQTYKEGAEYWQHKAEDAGSDGLPAAIYTGVGAAPAGVAEFMAGPVYAGAKGAAEGYQEGGVPGALEKAAIEVTKRVGIGKVFHGIENTAISGLPKAAVMGGTMGVQTAAEQAMTDKGIQPQDVAASAITGTLLSVSGGGRSEVIRKNLLKEGVQPEIAADLAGRFQFDDQASASPASIAITDPQGRPLDVPIDTRPPESIGPLVSETGNGSLRLATEQSSGLDPERQTFIKDQVGSLGSIEAVNRMFPGATPADVYARQVAGELYGSPERGFTMGQPSPLQVRTDMPATEGEVIPPEQPTVKPAPEPQTIDGEIVPAGLLPAPERGFVMKPYEGEVISPEPAKTVPEQQVVDGQIIPAGLIEDRTLKNAPGSPNGFDTLSALAQNREVKPDNSPFSSGDTSKLESHAASIENFIKQIGDTTDPALLGTIQKAKESLATIRETIQSNKASAPSPLETIYHPDKRIELRFPEAPNQKTITRLRNNRFEDQGGNVWIAKGSGKARREFVEKLQGEASEQYMRPKGTAPVPIKEEIPVNNPVGSVIPDSSETNPIDTGTVEQFTATAKKRGGKDVFDVKLNPSQRRTLEAVRQEISDGEAGKRVGIYNTNEPGSTQVSWGSSFPEYFRDKGYTKTKALAAIDNILNGDGVTALQKIMVEDMHQERRRQDTNQILTERAKPSEVSALHLDEGDTLKRNGEKFEVTDVGPDGVTLKDGVVLDLNHEEAINYDRGTLKDADGKHKKVNPESGNNAENSGVETFPHNGGVILDNLGLQQIYERISNARLIRDVMDDVKSVGRHVIAKGATTWKEFFQGMKDTLGDKFAKVRPVMERVWKILDNERGSIDIEAPRLRAAWDGILRAVNPMERGDLAEKTGELLRERMGVREMNRVRFSGELDAAVKKYEEQTGLVARGLDAIQNSGRTIADKLFSKMNEQDAYDFMQAVDTGDKAYFADKPALNDIAAVIDNMFQAKVKEIQNLGTGAMQNVRDSYFPHIWEKGEPQEQIAKAMGKRPLEGSKGFTKQRVFEDIQAGLDAGFKPVSQNPLDLVFLKMTEMDKYIAAHKGLQAMEESGVVELVPAGEKAPEGFFDIAGKYGIVTKQAYQDQASGMPGEMKSYRYVAVDEVAQVFNNYLSPTLYQNKYIGTPFEAYMGAANTLNQFQLGVGSLFHGGFTSLEAVISRFSLGLKSLSTGDLKGAAEYISTSPVAMVNNWKLGQKVLDAMRNGGAPQGEMADIMDWLQLAGARTAQDERFRTDQTQKVLQSWNNGKHFGAVAHSPLAVVEQSSRIILEHIVPQQKMGVFVEMMKQWADAHPGATHAELRTAAQAKWSRADARLGQVVYERYFIHNAVKNGLQALIRAPGWTAGTIFEIGGGSKDALESIIKLSKGEKTELSDRTAYTISLVAVTAIANGLATLFFTGDMPKGKDFLAFRTGNLDEKGKPERYVLPTYMKDMYAYSQAPASTLLHKAHPVIGLAGEIIKNRDYYGTEIRHPGDNPAKQVFDSVFHTAKAFTPFWIRGVAKERDRGGSVMAQVAPFFGVMPAPADMNATAAERKARELVVGKLPQGSRTKAQFEQRQIEYQIETALRKKDPGARMMIQQAKRDKLITAADEQQIRKKAATPLIVSATRSLDFPQALQVWEEATDQEKAKLKQSFIGKGERYMETHPYQEKDLRQQLREIRRFVGR